MAFSETVKDQAFARSGGRCECTRAHNGMIAPHHGLRCTKTFTRYGRWEAHHIVAESRGGSDTLSNCEALCPDCHRLTQSYGA